MCFIESMGQQEWVMSVIPARHLQENVSLRGLGKLILNNMN
jgi:hypothetical protein